MRGGEGESTRAAKSFMALGVPPPLSHFFLAVVAALRHDSSPHQRVHDSSVATRTQPRMIWRLLRVATKASDT